MLLQTVLFAFGVENSKSFLNDMWNKTNNIQHYSFGCILVRIVILVYICVSRIKEPGLDES